MLIDPDRREGHSACNRDFSTAQVKTLEREAYGTAHFIALG